MIDNKSKNLGLRARRKWYRLEYELVQMLKERGYEVQRVPLSGDVGGLFGGDIIWGDKKVELKGWANGFKELYKWLEGKDNLYIKADKKDWLIVVRLQNFLSFLEDGY